MNAEFFNLLNLAFYTVLVILVPILMWVVAKILSPSNPNPLKNSTYECGQIFEGKAHVRFTIHYYPYAMVYAIFGAFAILLLIVAPWVIRLPFGLDYGLIILAIVTITLVSAVITLKPTK